MNGWMSEQGFFTLFMRRKVGRSVLPLAQPKPAAAYCHLKSSSFFLLLAVFLLFSFIWLHSMLFKNSTQSDNEYGTLRRFLCSRSLSLFFTLCCYPYLKDELSAEIALVEETPFRCPSSTFDAARIALHEEIISRSLYNIRPANTQPIIWFLTGAPGA